VRRAAVILLALAADAMGAGWSPEFAAHMTNAVPDRRYLSNLYWAVQERCEATYEGRATVTNIVWSTSGVPFSVVVTQLYYGVPPPVITQRLVRWDYSNLVVCGVATQTWTAGGVLQTMVTTSLCPVAVTNALTNEIAYATLDVLEVIAQAALALPTYYLDTSLCPSGDCSGYFAAGAGSAPMWTAVDYARAIGAGTVVTNYVGDDGEAVTYVALTRMPLRRHRVLLGEAFPIPSSITITSGADAVSGLYAWDAARQLYAGALRVVSDCYGQWVITEQPGADCAFDTDALYGSAAWSPADAGPYAGGSVTARVTTADTTALGLRFVDRGTYPNGYTYSTGYPVVRVTVSTGSVPAVAARIEGTRLYWERGVVGMTQAQETVAISASTATVAEAACLYRWADITNVVVAATVDQRVQSVVVCYDGETEYAGNPSQELYAETLHELYRWINGLTITVPTRKRTGTGEAWVRYAWLERSVAGSGMANAEVGTDWQAYYDLTQTRERRYDAPILWGEASGEEIVDTGLGAWLAAGWLEEVGGGDNTFSERWGVADVASAQRSYGRPFVVVGTGALARVEFWTTEAVVDESPCATTAPPARMVLLASASGVAPLTATGYVSAVSDRAVTGPTVDPYASIQDAVQTGCPTQESMRVEYSSSGTIPGMESDRAEWGVASIYVEKRVTGNGIAAPTPIIHWSFRYRD